MQTRFISFVEVMTNIAIGFVVAYAATFVILPASGCKQSAETYFWITVFYTFVSVVRMYLVRRYFNGPFHIWLQRFQDANNKS